jgi:hypothetical protein
MSREEAAIFLGINIVARPLLLLLHQFTHAPFKTGFCMFISNKLEKEANQMMLSNYFNYRNCILLVGLAFATAEKGIFKSIK